ncbi:unnamed protein product [Ixodes pacificus]
MLPHFEDTLAVVPRCWMLEGKVACCWPKGRHHNFKRLVRKEVEPDENWCIHGVEVLRECCKRYHEGLYKKKLALTFFFS